MVLKSVYSAVSPSCNNPERLIVKQWKQICSLLTFRYVTSLVHAKFKLFQIQARSEHTVYLGAGQTHANKAQIVRDSPCEIGNFASLETNPYCNCNAVI